MSPMFGHEFVSVSDQTMVDVEADLSDYQYIPAGEVLPGDLIIIHTHSYLRSKEHQHAICLVLAKELCLGQWRERRARSATISWNFTLFSDGVVG